MGDLVHAGDPIARLSGDAYQAELQKTLAEIGEKQAQRALLDAGPRPEEVNLAKTRIARAEEQFKYAKSRLDRDDALFKKQLISRKEFEQSQEMAAVREKELNEARSQLKALLAGSRQEERDMLDAEIRGLEAQQRFLEDQWRSLTVISPVTGIVTTSHLKEKTGQYVKKGDLIAEVHDLSAVTAEIQIPEKEIADVKTGQPVVLKAMAYPAANFYGTVTAVAPVATEQQDAWNSERTVLVLTQFANTPPLLKPGMSGNAKIRCGKQRVVDLITRRLARFIRVEFWSWW
jgi:putative peptide zinc metalloprotease protein